MEQSNQFISDIETSYTAKGESIKLVAENYPISDYYDTADILTSLGIGEALITALSEKGVPTPLVATLLSAPSSRMGVLSPSEILNAKIKELTKKEK